MKKESKPSKYKRPSVAKFSITEPQSDNLYMREQNKKDAEFNKQQEKQWKQCKKGCIYWNSAHYIPHCTFLLTVGHSSNKGNGPGDCRSFIRKTT